MQNVHSIQTTATQLPKAHHLEIPDHMVLPIKTFKYHFDTTLKHSNATQNIYFSNYFEWQGTVRERWFFTCIAEDMLQNEGVFVTKQAHNEFIREAFPFQTVRCELNTYNIQRCSFYLQFRFYDDSTGALLSRGYQQIVFANHSKHIAKLRSDIIEKIKLYEIIVDEQ